MRLSFSISSRWRRISSLRPWASCASRSRSAWSVSAIAAWSSPIFWSVSRSSSRSRCWSSWFTRSVSAATILRSRAGGLAAALLAFADDDLAGRLERDRALRRPGAELREARLDGLGRSDDRLGPGRALPLEVGARARERLVELVLLAVEVGAELVLEVVQRACRPCRRGPRTPLRAAAAGALARVLVDVRDDVEREIEDPLEVAWADVEQDAEPARRALEVPDVADGAGELDVAHPLAPDLRASDLDAALVADDALVPDSLVLAAVALPVLGGTEDALVEQAVLLGLERAVVDRLRLRHLALRPLPDLVRAGQRDADRAEIIDLEHGSPPRVQRPTERAIWIWRRPRKGRHPSGRGRESRAGARRRQSSNPARLMPPRSGSRCRTRRPRRAGSPRRSDRGSRRSARGCAAP